MMTAGPSPAAELANLADIGPRLDRTAPVVLPRQVLPSRRTGRNYRRARKAPLAPYSCPALQPAHLSSGLDRLV